ncbi:winged helix DNA-binding domain-containing protein [Citricoccus muralis]|uniref:Winged helix DNA-binding domain-containing protein n=1 Tax=Citricoccus muralis TaxID=169134 RepID=A0ABY8H736_9MICC|nr:winged helix DNA-binding domain-containing protein [Citricoccus muralis]WFP16427.1 winged helix DNA-binding domain-containing protein [Citricoccus muralis]
MTNRPLARARLVAQGIVAGAGIGSGTTPGSTSRNPTPHEVARAFAALQGQDLPGVLSSIALRAGTSAQTVVDAFNRGEIVRAYPMRGTVFALAAEDALWISQLCNAAPVRAAINRRGQLGLENHHVATAAEVLERTITEAPTPGVPRSQVLAAWNAAGIATDGGRGYHLLVHFISTGHAIYGTLSTDGHRDHDVMLGAQWLPAGSDLASRFNDDEVAATAELLHRYVLTRGPLTLRDAAWWTKLPLRLLRPAAEQMLAEHDDVEIGTWTNAGPTSAASAHRDDEPQYWRAGLPEEVATVGRRVDAPLLLPAFDEVILGYPDRMYIVPEAHHEALVPGNNGVFRSAAVAGAQVIGFWKRGPSAASGVRRFVHEPFGTVSASRAAQLESRYAAFPFPR